MDTLTELASKLGLPEDTEEPKIRKAARKRMKEIHPDQNDGDFSSESEKQELLKITSILNNSNSNTEALTSVDQATDLVNVIKNSGLLSSQSQVSELRKDCKSEYREQQSSRYTFPRIGSGALAAVTSFLATFPGQLADDPVVGEFIATSSVRLSFLLLAFCSGLFFVLTWYNEKREREKLDWLLSSEGLTLMLDNLVAKTVDREDAEKIVFSRNEFARIVRNRLGRRTLYPLPSYGSVSPSTVDSVTDAHLAELERRGAIEEVDSDGWKIKYRLQVTGDL